MLKFKNNYNTTIATFEYLQFVAKGAIEFILL